MNSYFPLKVQKFSLKDVLPYMVYGILDVHGRGAAIVVTYTTCCDIKLQDMI